MYKMIIFDFFGVFCAPMATNWFKKAVPDYEAQKAEFQALCTQSDLGKLTRAEFNQKAAALAGVSVAEVEKGIEDEVIIDSELVTYVRKLKTSYRIACLSNGGHEWTRKVITDHGLADLFEEVVLSADLGIIKPDQEIYERTLEKLTVPATQTVFVDDREANVSAAEVCGMRGVVFVDTPQFVSDIEKLVRSDIHENPPY